MYNRSLVLSSAFGKKNALSVAFVRAIFMQREKYGVFMGRQKTSIAASQLQAVSKALVREEQVQARAKELTGKIARLQEELDAAKQELAAIEEILNNDPELTAAARQLMEEVLRVIAQERRDVVIANTNYVTADEKRELLFRILEEYRQENPEAPTMSYAAIKSALKSRYGIETASAGLFFRNELKEWKTQGGNKNKSVLLNLVKIPDQKSSKES